MKSLPHLYNARATEVSVESIFFLDLMLFFPQYDFVCIHYKVKGEPPFFDFFKKILVVCIKQ